MSTTKHAAADFDLEGWLADAHLPEATVRVNKYGHLAARLADLQAQHDKALRSDAADVRLSSKRGAAYPIAQEIEKVRAEMESGWLTIRLRALTGEELDRVNKAKDSGAKTLRSLSIQAVEPSLTEAQAKALREAIGVGQWTDLVTVASEVAFGKVVTPDFSASVSATLATGASSPS